MMLDRLAAVLGVTRAALDSAIWQTAPPQGCELELTREFVERENWSTGIREHDPTGRIVLIAVGDGEAVNERVQFYPVDRVVEAQPDRDAHTDEEPTPIDLIGAADDDLLGLSLAEQSSIHYALRLVVQRPGLEPGTVAEFTAIADRLWDAHCARQRAEFDAVIRRQA
jgi:hypothetical protein